VFSPVVQLTWPVLAIGVCLQFSLASVPITQERQPAARGVSRLRVVGTEFRTADAKPFAWRGISAFRLVEFVAHGREQEATRYLDWAASQRLTVVRIFTAAHHLFQLKPDDGLRALPRVLELAAARGLYVEIVPLVDTKEITVDFEKHVAAIAAVAAAHDNTLIEIANEPWHPTQNKRLHDPAYVKRLAALVPSTVPVALGSAEKDPDYAAGGYATWHSPRSSGQEGWQHVLDLADNAARLAQWGKPVVSDEPIGAAAKAIPGRRDNEPARFAAAAVVTRLAGLLPTFHYEGGLQAEIPAGRELECFKAWSAGLDLVSAMPDGGRFVTATELQKSGTFKGFRAVFGREVDKETWVAGIDPRPGAAATIRGGPKIQLAQDVDGVRVFRLPPKSRQ
jgi:hypothetical protein